MLTGVSAQQLARRSTLRPCSPPPVAIHNRLFEGAVRIARSATAAVNLPSNYEYAEMSDYAYLSENKHNVSLFQTGWNVREFHYASSQYGHTGCIFWHDKRKQIVIAHAGTDIKRPGTSRTNVLTVLLNRMDDNLLHEALYLITDPVVGDAVNKGYHLSFTGHSLGGFLAEMSVFACNTGVITGFVYERASAVTFESPGSYERMQVWNTQYKHCVKLEGLKIVSFLSSKNCVNTLYRHPGRVYELFDSQLETQKLQRNSFILGVTKVAQYFFPQHAVAAHTVANTLGFMRDLLESHSLANIKNMLEHTGLLNARCVCYEVTNNWPVLLGNEREILHQLLAAPTGEVSQAIREAANKIQEKLKEVHEHDPNNQVKVRESMTAIHFPYTHVVDPRIIICFIFIYVVYYLFYS